MAGQPIAFTIGWAVWVWRLYTGAKFFYYAYNSVQDHVEHHYAAQSFGTPQSGGVRYYCK